MKRSSYLLVGGAILLFSITTQAAQLVKFTKPLDHVVRSYSKDISSSLLGAEIRQIPIAGQPLLEASQINQLIDADRVSGISLSQKGEYRFLLATKFINRCSKITLTGPLDDATMSVNLSEMPLRTDEEGWLPILVNQPLSSPITSFNFRPLATWQVLVTINASPKEGVPPPAVYDISVYATQDAREYKLTKNPDLQPVQKVDSTESKATEAKVDGQKSGDKATLKSSNVEYNFGSMSSGAQIIYVSSLASLPLSQLMRYAQEEQAEITRTVRNQLELANTGSQSNQRLNEPIYEVTEEESFNSPSYLSNEKEEKQHQANFSNDDNPSTYMEFDPTEKESVAVMDLGEKRKIDKISVIHSKKEGALSVYIVNELPWEITSHAALLALLESTSDIPLLAQLGVSKESSQNSSMPQLVQVESAWFESMKPFASTVSTKEDNFSQLKGSTTEGRYVIVRYVNPTPIAVEGFRIYDLNVIGEAPVGDYVLLPTLLPEVQAEALITPTIKDQLESGSVGGKNKPPSEPPTPPIVPPSFPPAAEDPLPIVTPPPPASP